MVPSYDDLTPGIPDVIESENVGQLERFLGDDLNKRSGERAIAHSDQNAKTPDLPNSCLYACLRADGRERPAAERRLQTLLEVARDFSPRVRAVGDGEVLLDVSGLGALIGPPPVIAGELRRALHAAGIAAGVALAPSQTMARVLATQAPDYPLAQFPDLPVELLQPLERLPAAMNDRDRLRPYAIFETWGIATLADLAALPAAALSSRLGRRGTALQRLARGLDAVPFVPDRETPRFIGRLELEWPIDALEPLSFVFARLLEPLAAALERADRGAVALHLDLRLTDRSTETRLLALPAPIRDPRVLRTLLLLDLEAHPPGLQRGEVGANPGGAASDVMIDAVAIEIDPAPARITQFSLLQRALPSPETLSTLIARLSALVGESRVGSPELLDTHQPGAFEMRRFAPGEGERVIEGAQGAGAPLVLRRRRVPPAIRVRVERRRPVHLAAAHRSLPQGAVVQAAGPWRASGGWWGTDWNRDEWDVALSSGIVCRIFQDRVTACWFLDGIYD